ncbi:MAG TPA: ATP-binding protein [Waddliaceae bacterium]
MGQTQEQMHTENIFNMFYRINNSTDFPGNGIGLTICKKIAEMHQGFITAHSTTGSGSVFSVYLPVHVKK